MLREGDSDDSERSAMPQIFGTRVRAATAGSRLSRRYGPSRHVWAVDLPRTRSGITLDEFLRKASARPFRLSQPAQALRNLRLFGGRVLLAS